MKGTVEGPGTRPAPRNRTHGTRFAADLYRQANITMADIDWMEHAECRGASLDLFFVDRGEPAKPARDICDRCPVQRQCLDHAVEFPEIYGIWAGTNNHQRQTIRRRRTGAR